jgi:hypothetical protein
MTTSAEDNGIPAGLDYELLLKRVMGLAQIGCRLEGRDGHIWIEEAGVEEICTVLHRWLRASDLMLNNKIYGGVLEALDTVDYALGLCGKPSLLELFPGFGHMDGLFLGVPGAAEDRVSLVAVGNGGLY